MRLLDLYACAGGAGAGYARAGYTVYSIDLDGRHAKNNPSGWWRTMSALDALDALLAGRRIKFLDRDGRGDHVALEDFSAIHASPPCQAYSITRHSHSKPHPDLIEPTRDRLIATGLPYIIENVVGAPLVSPVLLCGSMFGLTARDTDGLPLRMERHRLFESNRQLYAPSPCFHDKSVRVAGAYGGGSVDRKHAQFVRRGGYTPAKSVRAELLGIAWPMTIQQLSQSIPPAYTHWLGAQLAGLPLTIERGQLALF